MKYKILLSVIMLGMTSSTYANCAGPVVHGECLSDTEVYGYRENPSNEPEHKSSTNAQYELKAPNDFLEYSRDINTPQRDQLNTNIDRNPDRRIGEYAGDIRD